MKPLKMDSLYLVIIEEMNVLGVDTIPNLDLKKIKKGGVITDHEAQILANFFSTSKECWLKLQKNWDDFRMK